MGSQALLHVPVWFRSGGVRGVYPLPRVTSPHTVPARRYWVYVRTYIYNLHQHAAFIDLTHSARWRRSPVYVDRWRHPHKTNNNTHTHHDPPPPTKSSQRPHVACGLHPACQPRPVETTRGGCGGTRAERPLYLETEEADAREKVTGITRATPPACPPGAAASSCSRSTR